MVAKLKLDAKVCTFEPTLPKEFFIHSGSRTNGVLEIYAIKRIEFIHKIKPNLSYLSEEKQLKVWYQLS